MEDYRRTIDGEEDIYNLEMWNWALGQNGNEPVSEFASRFGEKYDPEWREQSYDPCLHAITAFYRKRLGQVPVLQRQRRAHFEARRCCLCFGMYYFTAISSRPILCRPSTMRLRCSGRGFLMPLA